MIDPTVFDKELEAQCKKGKIEYSIANQVFHEYLPILSKSYEILGHDLFKELFWYEKEGDDIRMINWKKITTLFNKILNSVKLNKEEKLIVNLHITYIMCMEGIFSPNLNYLVWHTINNGFDFDIRNKKIVSYEEVIECTLGQKMNFLKKYNKFNVITEKIDVNLRNGAAHLFYKINGDKLIINNSSVDFYEQLYYLSSILHGMTFSQEIFDKYIMK